MIVGRDDGLGTAAASPQVPLDVVLPVERLVAPGARVAAHLGVAGVGVRAKGGPVEEAAPADAAEVLVRAGVQAPVFGVAGLREQRLAARLARPVPTDETRMWANAQRDGRPAEYRWRPLFNVAKFR